MAPGEELPGEILLLSAKGDIFARRNRAGGCFRIGARDIDQFASLKEAL
jgi:hypothetical protein